MPDVDLLAKAKPLLNRLQDLIHVEKEAADLGNGPAVFIRFFFTPTNAPDQPSHITFVCDPQGALEYGLLTAEEFALIPDKESK
jgi:hypothetical protein